MNKYYIIFENLQDKVNNGILTIEEAEKVNDIAYNKYIRESEYQHSGHMQLKYNAAKILNREPSELKNKKYKNPESSRKADLKYKYKENEQEHKRTIKRHIFDNNVTIHDIKDPKISQESDIKELKYMQKHLDMNNPKDVEKYNKAFKRICNKYGISENSSFYARAIPNESGEFKNVKFTEHPQSKEITKKDLKVPESDHKYNLPKGYILVHSSSVPDLTELKPTKFSNNHSIKNGINGRYHLTGRVYFTLLEEDTIYLGKYNYGKNLYKLTDNISGFYLDYEESNVKNLDKYPDIKKLVGKPVYVKTDKPLKVTKIKG